ncbi:S8 family peptidase [Rummeliibacillus sp. POC4]|uniref:S8 family peptidase n=1 Tax=Rummeliibacillus sp. POC4 TaxID=2305899 RepID=UPI000E66694A|nr:S8 family peptidase [Rummeliibacillus sp. POC4]RIJ69382.1 hypothetical protein D1606_01050 [Rummeliibacillus sp. POC4]
MKYLTALFIVLCVLFSNGFMQASASTKAQDYIIETSHISELSRDYPIKVIEKISGEKIYKIELNHVTKEILHKLFSDKRVKAITQNSDVSMPVPITPVMNHNFLFKTLSTNNWGFASMNFPSNYDAHSTIDIAVLDTGIDTNHPLLRFSIKNGFDAIHNKSFEDDHGHGTHVSGIIVQNTPQLKIVPVKVLDANGQGDVYSVVKGIYYAIDQDVDAMNMSFGIKDDIPIMKEAIDKAVDHGIMIIAASGNDSTNTLDYPARYPEVLAIGAYSKFEKRAPFSQYGANLDFVAPGENIWSSWIGDTYQYMSGTSMATPFVTKAYGLVKSVNTQLNVAQIEHILTSSSQALTGESHYEIGFGKIDVAKALSKTVDSLQNVKYLPEKVNTTTDKKWTIKMSLSLDANLFDSSKISVVDSYGNVIQTPVELDKSNPQNIIVYPPSNGYTLDKKYVIIIGSGLISKSGKKNQEEVRMPFTTQP